MNTDKKIIFAEHMGFCWGVRRAIKLATDAAAEEAVSKANFNVYTLGPLIHNNEEVERLKTLGILPLENLEQAEANSVIIIRAHGEPPETIDKIKKSGLKLIDATCPLVKRAQEAAAELKRDGYQVVILGDYEHPEVKSILGHIDYAAQVIENIEQAQNLKCYPKLGLLSQTTQSIKDLQAVASILIDKAKELKVYNTICDVASKAQRATEALSKQVDVMIVIGGLRSANTKRLTKIALSTHTPTYHIENASQIDPQWLNNKTKIGITAGTSTPDWVIEEVKEKIEKLC